MIKVGLASEYTNEVAALDYLGCLNGIDIWQSMVARLTPNHQIMYR